MSKEVMLKYLIENNEKFFPMTHVEAVIGAENIYNMIDKNKIEIESLKQEIQELKRKEDNK
ncbi:hypothetical protein [Staphylococcus auricularis]|uniref:hypothetical protein n=1 Tax=Staphylococcus auricularis TaxID=29379 RepID=UPI002DC04796|nr:hypothetical protein [Staphylococcus auricularis]MEB6569087.1 hypothetical protein [Staphylococcus auricularis]